MIPKSNEIRIEMSTKCNYNCVMCPRDKLTRKKETMSLELFKHLFDKINLETSQYDTLTCSGIGEPMLDETLDEKMIYAKKRNFNILILTNGSLLTVDRFKRFEDLGVTSVRVSMYGDSPEVYNATHRTKNLNFFHKVKENLIEISKSKKRTKLILTYNIIDEHNSATINNWIAYWNDKADLVEVWRPHNWVDGRNYRYVQSEKLKTCGRPFNTPLQVQVDGTVNMCCFDFNGKLLLGDLKTQSLEEIFESAMYKKILKCHRTGNFKKSGLICNNCDQRNRDKSDVMIYNSGFDIQERIKRTSTIYQNVTAPTENNVVKERL